MIFSKRQILLASCLLCLSEVLTKRATAADPTVSSGQAELRKAVNSLREVPSLDPIPVHFSIVGVHYVVPRNYLVAMSNWSGGPQDFAVLKVNLPDLKPLTEETHACFTANYEDRALGCEPLSFRIQGIGPPDADTVLSRIRDFFHNQTPILDSSGLELYRSGAESQPIENYTTVISNRRLLYECLISHANNKKLGLCRPVADNTKSGPVLHYFFDLQHLKNIVQIDAGLRDLVDGFVVTPGELK